MNSVKLGNKVLEIPIIQGGMGIGISLDRLAGAVAACGAMGVVSSAYAGLQAADFDADPKGVTLREIPEIIKRAKERAASRGLVGINIMVAIEDYAEHVKAAVRGGVDAIISGAGLPLALPGLADSEEVLLAPIVSSGRVAKLICKSWDRHHHRIPDFIVIEGAAAGGHLGFAPEDLEAHTTQSNLEILAEVREAIQPFEASYERAIPLFVAGGVYDHDDIKTYLAHGAGGVQIGTRFIATDECDADQAFKDVIIQAQEKDIVLTKSPVGMPGRAVRTPLIERVAEGQRTPPSRCYKCLGPCDVKTTPYCISQALMAASRGDLENGLFFAGENGARIDRMMSVRELINELVHGKGTEA